MLPGEETPNKDVWDLNTGIKEPSDAEVTILPTLYILDSGTQDRYSGKILEDRLAFQLPFK